MPSERASAPQAERHQEALRYFLRRHTTIGLTVGEFSIEEVLAAMRYFADGGEPLPRKPRRPFSLLRLLGLEVGNDD